MLSNVCGVVNCSDVMHLTSYTQTCCVHMPHAMRRETSGTDRAGQAENEGPSAAGQGSKSASGLALRATQQAGSLCPCLRA